MRTLAAALGIIGLLLLPAPASAQTCAMGQVYCSAGWCCPTTADGGTNVCCNSNPQASGCTTTGFCGTSAGDGGGGGGDGGTSTGDGGSPVCANGDFYCSAGWCCPPGQGGRSDVCCNMNSMANGCTSNGNCSTGSGGSGSSSGGLMPPAGCGTSATFNQVNCGTGGAFCPANATCMGTSCQCAQGYVALDCSDNLCNGMCSAPNYWCAPSSALGGSSGGSGGSGSSGGSGGGGGGGTKCDAAGAGMNGPTPWLALIAGAAALALWRGRRSLKA
ncbi:MAG TPA: hypothetical protein VMI75_06255 [Polyangiaceae bacterium]|nr:hypothetical protein [Polyangiaceae bacterium]